MTIKDVSNLTKFTWETLGNIEEGRENLGREMPVMIYRLFQYTLRDVLSGKYGEDTCNDILREAGTLAGQEFAKNCLDCSMEFNQFIAALQKSLKDLKVGIFRVEEFDEETGSMILTVSEDLDCSGLPVTGKTVCNYDEGFIAGLLSEYTKCDYRVIEIDCWVKGDRVCRFKAEIKK